MFTEDLAVFFTDFAEEATYNDSPIQGIFDNGHGEILSDLSGTNPRYTCRSVDVDLDPRDQIISIGSVDYNIIDFEPDGTGVVVLILEKS